MIDLANKCVLIRTHEEYENILKAAKKQGYRWYGGKEAYPYPFEEQQIPDILKFYGNKELTRNASLTLGYDLTLGYELVEASDVIEDEKKLKDAINLVRTFAEYPDITPNIAISAFAVLHQYCSSISPHDCIRCTFYEHCPECFMGCPGDQGETIRKLQSNE